MTELSKNLRPSPGDQERTPTFADLRAALADSPWLERVQPEMFVVTPAQVPALLSIFKRLRLADDLIHAGENTTAEKLLKGLSESVDTLLQEQQIKPLESAVYGLVALRASDLASKKGERQKAIDLLRVAADVFDEQTIDKILPLKIRFKLALEFERAGATGKGLGLLQDTLDTVKKAEPDHLLRSQLEKEIERITVLEKKIQRSVRPQGPDRVAERLQELKSVFPDSGKLIEEMIENSRRNEEPAPPLNGDRMERHAYVRKLMNFGATLIARQEFSRAMECYKKAFRGAAQISNEMAGHQRTPLVAQTLTGIAHCNLLTGDRETARKQFHEAINILSPYSESAHMPDTLRLEQGMIFKKLGDIYRGDSDMEAAIGYYERALKDLKRASNGTNIVVGMTYIRTAECYEIIGDRQRSEEYREQGLEIIRRVRGQSD